MQTIDILTVLLAHQPGMALSQAFTIANDLRAADAREKAESLSPTTIEGRIAAARLSPEIMREVLDSRKIQAIKELRGLVNCSLKEAKDAIDVIFNEVHGTQFRSGY